MLEEGLCTYCSAPKRSDEGLLPAKERYLSDRISGLVGSAEREGLPMWILSGRFGLLEPDTLIPWYDRLLSDEEVSRQVAGCAEVLRRAGIRRLTYHTASVGLAPELGPYLRLIESSCGLVGVECRVVTLPGVPV